ncbi:MAG: VWA domain-containing protein [Pyrinomonadaceae bacterium]
MKKFIPVLLLLLPLFVIQINVPVTPQTRPRTVVVTRADGNTKVSDIKAEVVKVDVDLVTVDALVLQKKTARVVGNLKAEDFVLSEDGIKQTITHFGQDSLPLSVLLLIDRGGCLDPFGSEVRYAARAALSRLKPADEVAVMTYHNTVELLQEFTHNFMKIEDALNRVPPHDEHANHCLNRAFYEAANYMVQSGNPEGRRVVIVITGVKRNFDCPNGPSGKAAMQAVFESGSVVCGIIPKTAEQAIENGMMRWATRIGGLARVSSLNIDKLAEETGGEVLEDKPENLDRTFNTLINDLRSRYSLAFVSSNKNRDGTLRKLKIELAPSAPKSQGKLVVKARRSYVAPKATL